MVNYFSIPLTSGLLHFYISNPFYYIFIFLHAYRVQFSTLLLSSASWLVIRSVSILSLSVLAAGFRGNEDNQSEEDFGGEISIYSKMRVVIPARK